LTAKKNGNILAIFPQKQARTRRESVDALHQFFGAPGLIPD
jgi:truncated hemoglobin YjbI